VNAVNAQDPAQTETTTTPEEVQMSPIVIPVSDKKSLQIWTSFVKRPSIAWVWSYNMKQATVFCTTYDNSETFNTVIVKTVAIRLSGELHFMYNGINITHCELPSTFSNFETLSTTIELFNKLQPFCLCFCQEFLKKGNFFAIKTVCILSGNVLKCNAIQINTS
jgi:hypothetical protein